VSRIGIVTGMAAESGCLTVAFSKAAPEARPLLYCAAASADRAYAGACDLVEQGASALLSFGIAGGLAPHLPPGALIVPESVIEANGRYWQTTPHWRETIHRELIADESGSMLASEAAIRTVSEKASLHFRTGAVAVDMESGGVARAAEEAGVPFLVVRAIADPAHRRLPPSALAGLGQDGRRRPFAVVVALARRPWDTRDLIRLGRDSGRAMKRLRSIAARGPAIFRTPVG